MAEGKADVKVTKVEVKAVPAEREGLVASWVSQSAELAEKATSTWFGIARDVRGEVNQRILGTFGFLEGTQQGFWKLMRGLDDRFDKLTEDVIDTAESMTLGVIRTMRDTGHGVTELATGLGKPREVSALLSLVEQQGPDGIQFRRIHGYRRAFVCAGSGPALLLIHGIGDRSDTWSHLIPTLARDYTVIAPDLLGHGRSDKPRADYSVAAYANAMRDLLSVLGVERATVVGHSLGGGVAMQFAYQYPERCERLVLVSTGGISREVHPLLRLASAPNADLLLPLLRISVTRIAGRCVLRALQRLGTDIGHDADDLQAIFEALPDPTAQRAFIRTLRAVVDWRGQVITMLDRCYLTRGMPTLLIWGTRDAVVPYAHAHLAHAAMPGSRLEVFDGAGHFPHHADRARFLGVLRDFLATTQPASYSAEQWRDLLRRGRPSL